MTEHDTVESGLGDSKSQPVPKQWLWQRVAALEPQVKQMALSKAGLASSAAAAGQQLTEGAWGFATRLPTLDHLFERAQQNSSCTETQAPASGYPEALHDSRSFRSPDCVQAMAEAYGMQSLLSPLQGSAILPSWTSADAEALDSARSSLKQRINSGWSQEAVRRGVAHAKNGNYEEAHASYRQALELDRRNVDAWVARGAAHANKHLFAKAVVDFETALEIDPVHENAVKYLDTIKKRMQQLGLGHPAAKRLAAQVSPVPKSGNVSTPLAGSGNSEPGSQASGERTQREALSASSTSSGASASSSSDSREGDERMDVQRALDILSKHYKSRNVPVSIRSERKGAKKHSKRKRRKEKHSGGVRKAHKSR